MWFLIVQPVPLISIVLSAAFFMLLCIYAFVMKLKVDVGERYCKLDFDSAILVNRMRVVKMIPAG